MKKWLPSLILPLLGSSLYAGHGVDNNWSFLAEFVYMRRSELSNKVLAKDPNDPTCHNGCTTLSVLNSEKLVQDFDFEPGVRVGLSFIQDVKSTYEATFMYVWEWESSKSFSDPDGDIFYPFHNPNYTVDYADASEVNASYRSHYYTFELNYWRNVCRRKKDYFSVSGIFGLRYVNLDESCRLVYFSGSDKSNYNTWTKNDIIGVQLGGNFEMNPLPHFSMDLTAKAGLGYNRAANRVLLQDQNNTVILRKYGEEHWQDVVFADAAGALGYQVRPNFNVHAGYEVFFVSGVALAPEQYTNSSALHDRHFNRRGFVIIHGLFVGFNYDF